MLKGQLCNLQQALIKIHAGLKAPTIITEAAPGPKFDRLPHAAMARAEWYECTCMHAPAWGAPEYQVLCNHNHAWAPTHCGGEAPCRKKAFKAPHAARRAQTATP